MHHHRSNGFSVSGKCVTHKWKQRGGVRWYSMVRPRRKMKLLNDTIVTWVLKWQKHKIYLWTCYSWSTSIFFCDFSQFKGSSFSIAPEQEREYGIFWMYWALIWMIAPNKVGVCWFGGRGGGGGGVGGGRGGESAHKLPKTNATLFTFGQQVCLCKLTELDNDA